MNIFATSDDPAKCAQALDDSRLRKMVTETAQLLSAAVRETDGGDHTADGLKLYKRPPSGQELVRWASRTRANYRWLVAHGQAMAEECRHRFGKVPVSAEVIWKCALLWQRVDEGPLEPFVNRARNLSEELDYSAMADVHRAYRLYLCHRWARAIKRSRRPAESTWTRRGPPVWSWGATLRPSTWDGEVLLPDDAKTFEDMPLEKVS